MSTNKPLIGALAGLTDLGPIGQTVYLYRIRASLIEALDYLDCEFKAYLSDMNGDDRAALAKAFGVPRPFIDRLAVDVTMPDAILLYEGIKAARVLPDLPVEAICEVQEALEIENADDLHIFQLAQHLCTISEHAPLTSDVWADAPVSDKMTFQRAVDYAKQLTGLDEP